MNAQKQAYIPPETPSVEDVINFASQTMEHLFNGYGYSRQKVLQQFLTVPDLWLIPGDNLGLTEVILTDLEALLTAQIMHLRRGRRELFDVARFWLLVEACRGEARILVEQRRRKAEMAAKRAAHLQDLTD
jgi:hypothetical protein